MTAKKKIRDKTESPVKLTAKCIMGHKEVLTKAQIDAAQRLGVAMCSQCGNVAIVQKVSGKG